MNPSTALASVLLDELARCGVHEIVVAPGSRSAPLAMAAHADERLRLHVRVDERSAGFLALGLGKASGRPAAVVCTSGTATANLHPAVIEAAQSGIGLLVLTADRPPELRDTGANQTIDQIKIYGGAVRWFCELGVPEARAGAVSYWRSVACRAWGHASGPDAGPVHLNIAFREPLTPDGSPDWPESLDGRPGAKPWTSVATPDTGDGSPAGFPSAERGLLVMGDRGGDPAPYVAWAQRRGWPVLAESTSGARYGPNAISTYHYLLNAPGFAASHRPDVVVTVGKPGLSRALLAMLEMAGEHVVVGGASWVDPTRTATEAVNKGSGDGFAVPAASDMPADSRDVDEAPAAHAGPWLSSWLSAERAARAAIDMVLDEIGQDGTLCEPGLARDLWTAVPDDALVFAGSSMPIRDLDRTADARRGPRVVGNRGASGIDGSVSTAVGAALAHQGPSYALLGDLALVHDQNGLLLGSDEPRPDLTIVVVNNDGGGIFSMLPQAAHPGPFERVFGTSLGVDLANVAAAARVPYTRVECPDQLSEALIGDGLRLVEARTERRLVADVHQRLQRAVDAATGS